MTVAGAELIAPPPPRAEDLDVWNKRLWDFDGQVAGALGFAISTIRFSGRQRVLISEFSRSKEVGPPGKSVRYGVAVRLLVQVTQTELNANLSLPIVAAQAQMGLTSASSSLSVHGYVGNLSGKILPDQDFNVESYVALMHSVAELQDIVTNNVQHIRPVLLEVPDVVVDLLQERQKAIGVVWALSNIADGRSYAQAMNKFALPPDAVISAIQNTYRDLLGTDSHDAKPWNEIQQKAELELGKLRLRRRTVRFW